MGVVASFAIHGLVIAGMMTLSYLMSRAPKDEGTKVTFIAPPPPPPPPPPGGGGKKQQTKPKTPKVTPVKKNQLIQPKEIPKEKPKEEEEQKKDDDKPEVDGGVEGGVEGGVKGGVVGGVIGGVLGGSLGGQLGAPGLYEKVSRAPALISGNRQPPVPPNVLLMVRGSKGIILCKIKINARGKVDDVEIVRSTMPALDDIVRKYIKSEWEFEAPLNAGRPVSVEYLQPFTFVF